MARVHRWSQGKSRIHELGIDRSTDFVATASPQDFAPWLATAPPHEPPPA